MTGEPPFPLVETFLAVNPVDPTNLLVSAQSTGADRALLYGTWDGGATWSPVESPTGPAFGGGDPMVTFDASGRAYFATIDPEVHVWRSSDGGRSWTGPVVVGRGRTADREWVAAGAAPNGGVAPVHAAAKVRGQDGRDALLVSSSRDGGATFDPVRLVPLDSGYLNTATGLVVRRDGSVLLAYLANYGRVPDPEELFRGSRWLMVSQDTGGSWSQPYPVAPNLQYGNRSWDRAMMGLGGGGVAMDASGGPRDGWLYMTWAAVMDRRLQNVVARSEDGGRTWAVPVRVNHGGFDVDHSMPTVAVNGSGVVLVTWNDRRDEPGAPCFHHYASASADGARSFGPDRRVSDTPTCPGAGSRWLNGGDTQGLAALPDGTFRTVWSVGREGDLRLWT
ncbi:MAG TPA: hypothetical protein VE173_14935, partial [Longimicrobiales bacterium]|nr:hypothetical protein [Longimicrobiales bacterium]